MTRSDWLDADDQLYRSVAGFLAAGDFTLAALAAFGQSRDPARELGFEASRVRRLRYAGTATATLDAIVFADRIAQLAICVSWGVPDSLADARPRFLAILGDQLELARAEPLAQTARRDDAALAALHAERARVLGPVPPRDLPPALRDPYAALVELGNEHVVGERCGYAAQWAAGSLETRALVDARRPDLLGDILRGPNPEARVYAARALIAGFAAELDATTRAAIAEVRDLEIPIRSCSGCDHWDTLGAELVPEFT